MKEKLDVFEVVLKQDIGISLTPLEQHFLENLDEEIKNTVQELINNVSFLDEVERNCEHIIHQAKSSELPLEQQEEIEKKCKEKIRSLKQLKFSSKSDHIKVKN